MTSSIEEEKAVLPKHQTSTRSAAETMTKFTNSTMN